MRYIVPFSDLTNENMHMSGGKAASLAKMTKNNINVPPGYVVMSNTFTEFIENSHLKDFVSDSVRSIINTNSDDIESVSKTLRSAIVDTPIPTTMSEQIIEAYRSLGSPFVAVRSSALAEDGQELSWAGELDTFLYVSEDELLLNIKRCWASFYSSRSILYQTEHNILDAMPKMGVVVQAMITPEVSGVGFSVNPISQSSSEIIIEAALGLGEAVVSGSITPDNYTIDKNRFKILDIHVAKQDKLLVRKNDKVAWTSTDKNEKSIQKLSRKHILMLASEISMLEKMYELPVDIEWSLKDDVFYILQCRPITTLDVNSSSPVDWPVEKRYARTNSTEALNDLRKIFVNSAWETQKVAAVPLYLCCATQPSAWDSRDFLAINYKHLLYVFENDRCKLYYDIDDWTKIARRYFSQYESIDNVRSVILQHKLDYLESVKAAKTAYAASDTNVDSLLRAVQYACERLAKAMGYAHAIEGIIYDSEKKLRNACGQTISEQEFSTLCSPIYASFLRRSHGDLLNIKDAPLSEREELTKDYVKKYSWQESSYFGRSTLNASEVQKRLDNLGDVERIDDVDISDEKIHLIEKYGLDHNAKFIIQTIEECFKWQDDRKSYILRSIDYLDEILVRLAKASGIPHHLLKYALPVELSKNTLQDKNYTTELEARSKGSAFILDNGHAPRIISGENFIKAQALMADDMADSELDFIKGIAASIGTVTGAVRVCESISDISLVEDGEVLVASMTRPEYLPAMLKASAFVTDEGGITCHASIISRELKKPCVIGTRLATSILKTGMIVEVNGFTGRIKILKKSA